MSEFESLSRQNAEGKESLTEGFSSDNYRKFFDSFTVTDDKVVYYCNKTTSLKLPLYKILDDLVKLQYQCMAYVQQGPKNSDHFGLSMTFALITKTAAMIDWKALNQDHSCFWQDFLRDIKELKRLYDRVQITTLECVHTATSAANRAFEILEDVVFVGNKEADARLKSTMIQIPGGLSKNGVKVLVAEPNETIVIQYNSPEHGPQSFRVQQARDSFRLRFLRSLIFFAKKSLECIHLTMLQIDLIIRLEFPFEKLAKCNGILSEELLPRERALLTKAKREFDGSWDDIWATLARFKMQLDGLQKYRYIFKKLRKEPLQNHEIIPTLYSVSINFDDPSLLKIVNQALSDELIDQGFDYPMIPSRTKDMLTAVDDMWEWSMDNRFSRQMCNLSICLCTALGDVEKILSPREIAKWTKDINELMIQADRARRYLKKTLQVFKNKAFIGLKLKKSEPKMFDQTMGLKSEISLADIKDNDDDDREEDGTNEVWVKLQGGYRVTLTETTVPEFVVCNQFKEKLYFSELDEEQKVVLLYKMLTQLLDYMSATGCFAKVLLERAYETKSLVKRLKPKEETIEHLKKVLETATNQMQRQKQLIKQIESTFGYIHSNGRAKLLKIMRNGL